MKSKFIEEFKAFAFKGNVVDLAIAVIIGGAFGKIVSSLVTDIIMPLIGILLGGIDLKSLAYTFHPYTITSSGVAPTVGVTIQYGLFLQSVVDFLIIALSIFVVIKLMMKLSKKTEEGSNNDQPTSPPAPDNK